MKLPPTAQSGWPESLVIHTRFSDSAGLTMPSL